MDGKMRFESSANGSTKGAITCDDIKKYKILIPPLEEQNFLVDTVSRYLQDLDEIVQKTLEGIDKLNELKQVFISHYVTGKIKV